MWSIFSLNKIVSVSKCSREEKIQGINIIRVPNIQGTKTQGVKIVKDLKLVIVVLESKLSRYHYTKGDNDNNKNAAKIGVTKLVKQS